MTRAIRLLYTEGVVLETYVELPARQPSRTLAMFAHWDPHNMVDPHVVHYLKALHALDVAILFVSTCPTLAAESVEALHPLCAGIYTRENIGYDFSSWNQGFRILDEHGWTLQRFDRLVLTNDTLYGPLYPLTEMWDTFHGAHMYGALESWEQRQHLQSFFLVFDLDQVTRPFLRNFWVRDYEHLDKYSGVQRYEIGLSTTTRDAGWRLKPFLSLNEAEAVCKRSPAAPFYDDITRIMFNAGGVNHSLVYWDILIKYARFPFLKSKIFQLPPGFVGPWHPTTSWQDSMDYLQQVVESCTDYPFELIASSVQRFGLAPEQIPDLSALSHQALRQILEIQGLTGEDRASVERLGRETDRYAEQYHGATAPTAHDLYVLRMSSLLQQTRTIIANYVNPSSTNREPDD